jgi:beta-lactamase class A
MKISNNKNVYITLLILFVVLSNVCTYYFSVKKVTAEFQAEDDNLKADVYSGGAKDCSYDVKRLAGNFTRPLLFVDDKCESNDLSTLKQDISNLIDNLKNSGILNGASVYFKEYSNNEWTGVNEDEKYYPGSLYKVPELIAYMKMNEKHPGLLDKKLTFAHSFSSDIKPSFGSKSIVLGQQYTIRELLRYMIVYSDNNAAELLNDSIDKDVLKKVFSDIGLSAPDLTSATNLISPKEFSYFMRTLYNATYLSIEDSEFANKLLSQSNFKDGMLGGLPPNTRIAHKFGESGNQTEQQLHESAIVYLDNDPYVITIMTKGNDIKKLPEAIKQISALVYRKMAAN